LNICTRLIAEIKYKMNSEHLSCCQVKHVLAGSEYSGSAAAQRDERALVFGDDVPADKFRSCKKHGSDPRSLNDFTTEDIEKMKNVSFSDPEYTNKVLLVVNLASF